MVSKLDETLCVVVISPKMYVVKCKGGYYKNQWYSVYEVVPITSKHRCFYRKHLHYKYNILFVSDLSPKCFMCSTPTIHTNILKVQTAATSFAKYYAFSDTFFSKTPMKLKVD